MTRARISGARLVTMMLKTGASSRAELSARLGLSKASIGRLVERLIAAGLIEEGPRVSNCRRGRKTTSLRVRPDLAYALGTDLEGMALRACLIDCSNRLVASAKRTVKPNWSIEKIVKEWVSLIEWTVRKSGIPAGKISGLGVGLPGTGSRGNLQIRAYLPPGRWVDFDVGSSLARFRLPIAAWNNVVCVSEYERRLGAAKGAGSFISILARYGIGAAVYSDGAFLIGEGTFTGEIGHMRLDARGPLCICGKRGCLDAFASGRTWPAERERTGPKWRRQLARGSRYLAVGLANLLKLFHPPLVIFNGLYNEYEKSVRPILKRVLHEELTILGLPVPEILFGESVEFKSSIGAALRARDEFLEGHLLRNVLIAETLPSGKGALER